MAKTLKLSSSAFPFKAGDELAYEEKGEVVTAQTGSLVYQYTKAEFEEIKRAVIKERFAAAESKALRI